MEPLNYQIPNTLELPIYGVWKKHYHIDAVLENFNVKLNSFRLSLPCNLTLRRYSEKKNRLGRGSPLPSR